ncbi:MAG: DMT family transporter [Pirellulaceae bacterium]
MAGIGPRVYNSGVNTIYNGKPGIPSLRNAATLGTIYGLISSAGYTFANIYLRSLVDCHPTWVSCVKAIPTLMLVVPWLIIRRWRGNRQFPAGRAVALLAITGLFGHLCGNVVFQWSLGVIGLVLAVPLTLGTMIVTGAFLGHRFLHEHVSRATIISVTLLIVAVFILSLSAGEAHENVQSDESHRQNIQPVSVWILASGVAAACLAGFAYSLLGAAIRYGLHQKLSLPMTLGVVSLVGLISLTLLSLMNPGLETLLQTTHHDLRYMFYAGIWNAVGFLALAKALNQTSLIHVNALSATQVGMTVVAGLLLFDEALTWMTAIGVGLTILGLLLMREPTNHDSSHASHETAEPPGSA